MGMGWEEGANWGEKREEASAVLSSVSLSAYVQISHPAYFHFSLFYPPYHGSYLTR